MRGSPPKPPLKSHGSRWLALGGGHAGAAPRRRRPALAHVEHVGVAQGERAQQDEVELHRDRPPCVSQSHVKLRADAVASMGSERRRPGDAPAKAAIFHASAPGNAFSAACRRETAQGCRPGRSVRLTGMRPRVPGSGRLASPARVRARSGEDVARAACTRPTGSKR